MRIAFVCGSLEPGRSGVGDYAISLAAECARRGHACCAVALNDRHVAEPCFSESSGVEVLRLPPTLAWGERIKLAASWLACRNAEWVSFQMVVYGFDNRGIIAGLGRCLRRLSEGRKTHVMFHELWIGLGEGSLWKARLIGGLQKYFFLDFVQRVHPDVAHTNCSAYSEVLARCGVKASVLPLFSAIAPAAGTGGGWPLHELRAAGIPITVESRKEFWLLGLFGTIHPQWRAYPLLGYLGEAASHVGKRLVIAAMGHMDAVSRGVWDSIPHEAARNALFHHFGARGAAQMSEIFNTLDFGLATSPWALIGKSSSAAAMLDHGLPVIVSRDDVRFRGYPPYEDAREGLLKMDAELPRRILEARRRPARWTLPEVAARFLNDLEAAETHPAHA